jgi:acetolactate synthase-1/2/3 large subunit
MKLTGGQIVCESLLREGVEVVFGIPGGALIPLYDTLPQYPELRHILTRHEQGAAHAADGYSRATGKVGVAFGTSGPGATNLVTGIACAHMDSIPTVFITGQVARAAIGKDAFQETDVTGITLPITKHNYLVMRASDIAEAIKEAFFIAKSGRPGPVLVDIPKDVFTEVADFAYPEQINIPSYTATNTIDRNQINGAANLINNAARPLILAGHGVIFSDSYDELLEIAEKAQIPVITTLLGISSFPETHRLSVGMPGMHGMAYASLAIDEADVVIGLGMRFDDRVTGDTSKFAPNAKIVHIEIDPTEINKNIHATAPVIGDLKCALKYLVPEIHSRSNEEWIQRIEELKRDHPLMRESQSEDLLPQHIIQAISDSTNGNAIIVTGVGQHQMWAAQHFTFSRRNSFITSGGLGTMGFEVPAALGAQVGRPGEVVWSIAGDGGFQMTMSELATIKENNIPVKFAIFNNNNLGMVRQWQEMFYDKNYVAVNYTGNPDFVKLAEAFGILGLRVDKRSDMVDTIRKASEHNGPVVIDFVIPSEQSVYPMIPAGTSTEQLMEEPEKGVAK